MNQLFPFKRKRTSLSANSILINLSTHLTLSRNYFPPVARSKCDGDTSLGKAIERKGGGIKCVVPCEEKRKRRDTSEMKTVTYLQTRRGVAFVIFEKGNCIYCSGGSVAFE
ncbi:hypothetical protein CEXT_365051 [Caerostris extrusa]|uniref:Uncharacterized protein n=1 Tax=Caerostris extrusa TaxID=172846 RepID=A0AAV4XLJ7_CAEEX|nr:hypothetical protein CEXT_365051 [Caerostris extrusa]